MTIFRNLLFSQILDFSLLYIHAYIFIISTFSRPFDPFLQSPRIYSLIPSLLIWLVLYVIFYRSNDSYEQKLKFYTVAVFFRTGILILSIFPLFFGNSNPTIIKFASNFSPTVVVMSVFFLITSTQIYSKNWELLKYEINPIARDGSVLLYVPSIAEDGSISYNLEKAKNIDLLFDVNFYESKIRYHSFREMPIIFIEETQERGLDVLSLPTHTRWIEKEKKDKFRSELITLTNHLMSSLLISNFSIHSSYDKLERLSPKAILSGNSLFNKLITPGKSLKRGINSEEFVSLCDYISHYLLGKTSLTESDNEQSARIKAQFREMLSQAFLRSEIENHILLVYLALITSRNEIHSNDDTYWLNILDSFVIASKNLIDYENKVNNVPIKKYSYASGLDDLGDVVETTLDIEKNPIDRYIQIHDEAINYQMIDDEKFSEIFNSTFDSFTTSLMYQIEGGNFGGGEVDNFSNRIRLISNRTAAVVGTTLALEIWIRHWRILHGN